MAKTPNKQAPTRTPARAPAQTNSPKKGTEVAKVKKPGEVAEMDDADLAAMRADAGKGVSTSAEDNIMPLIYILQSQSKQALKQKSEYIDGAEAGMIWPRGTTVLIDGEEGLPVIPCGMRKFWVEWKPDRGGFVMRHDYDETREDRGRPDDAEQVEDPKTGNMIWVRNESGNVLVETREHAVLAYYEEMWNAAVIAMSGSNHTMSRGWNGEQLRKRFPPPNNDFTPPGFAFVYTLKTTPKTNDKGDWYGWAFENGMDGEGTKTPTRSIENGVELYGMAKALQEAYYAGVKQAEAPQAPDSDNSDSGGDGNI